MISVVDLAAGRDGRVQVLAHQLLGAVSARPATGHSTSEHSFITTPPAWKTPTIKHGIPRICDESRMGIHLHAPGQLNDEEAGLRLRQHLVAIAPIRREHLHVVVRRVLRLERQALPPPPERPAMHASGNKKAGKGGRNALNTQLNTQLLPARSRAHT